MSILFMDNFSNYGSGFTGVTNAKDGIYADTINDVSLDNDPDGSPGKVLALRDTSTEYIRKVLPNGAVTTLGVHFRVWYEELPISNSKHLLQFADAANNDNLALQVNSTGTFDIVRGSTVIGSTTIPVITAHGWYHIEMKVLFNDTTGTAEVRVNEVPVIALTNVDTCNTTNIECSQIRLTNGSNTDLYVKDLIIWDSNGTVNNDFMGDYQVVTLVPNADVSVPWAKSTGTDGYALLDETSPDDADYISADATPPALSEFSFTDLDPDVVLVAGLMTVTRALKTDSGTAKLQVGVKSNGDVDLGQDRAITTSATYWTDVSELSPDTAAAYTPVEVNNITATVNRTA